MRHSRSTNIRRVAVVCISVLLLIGVLFYVEHPMVRVLKHVVASVGIIDSQHTVIGMTDIRSVDHIRGDKNSDVMLIEYSDMSCVMCAAMQESFDKIVEEEGILLVSRHLYPHTRGDAFEAAVAAECVAKHTNKDAFFSFIRFVYENQSTAIGDMEVLAQKAEELGTDARQFQECIATDAAIRKHIEHDSNEGWRLGSRGTPYIVVVYKDRPVGISYANEYSAFLSRVKMLIAKARP